MLGHLFWHFQKGGCLKYKPFLNTCYVAGVKVPQDASVHLVGAREDAVRNSFAMIRCATAFAELHTVRNMKFEDGTLEIDATKTNIKRTAEKKSNRSAKSTHCGHFLVVYHRETKQYALEPLNDKAVLKGPQPPPETYAEVNPVVKKHLNKGHLAASDSSQAIKKSIKESGFPHVTVIHKRKNFSHVVKLPKNT